MSTTALSFLDAVQGYVQGGSRSSADRAVRLATVDPTYDPWDNYPDPPAPARVTFDGETTLSGKAYPYVSGYVPWAGTRVVLVPIGNSYLITGSLNTQTPQGFWQNATGTESGVELGGGSYYDTDEGLVIAGDVSLSGDLDVDGVGAYLFKRRGSDSANLVNNTLATDASMGLALSVGTWEVHHYIVYSGTTGNFQMNWNFTGTWSGLKTCHGISPFPINTGSYAASTTDTTTSRDSSPQRLGVHQLGTSVPYNATDASNYQGAHEWAVVTVTVAGTWQPRYAQHNTQAGAPSVYRGDSFQTARRVA